MRNKITNNLSSPYVDDREKREDENSHKQLAGLEPRQMFTTLSTCKKIHEAISTRIGHQLYHMEHVVYGMTYFAIGLTHMEWLYYAFGTFVFITIIFGQKDKAE